MMGKRRKKARRQEGKKARRQEGKKARRQEGKKARRQEGKKARKNVSKQKSYWFLYNKHINSPRMTSIRFEPIDKKANLSKHLRMNV